MSENTNKDYEDDFIDDLQNYKYLEMVEKARNIVLVASTGTGITGAIPIPFADAPIMISEQVMMMIAINTVFKFDVKKDILKSLVMAVLGTVGATVIGKTVVSGLLKLLPGVGSVTGAVVSGSTGAAVTLLMGNAYIEVCKAVQMGELSLDELDKKKGKEIMKKAFTEQMQKKKEEVN